MYIRSLLIIVIAIYFFIIPFSLLLHDLRDPGLKDGSIPEFTYRWHRQLSKGIHHWAEKRIASNAALNMDVHDISGTEWPIFTAVYYLWATESLQRHWEKHPEISDEMPKKYAEHAIEAAAKLVSDPNHAEWVKQHWGENYLYQENLFYRMLLISGLTSYQNLSSDTRYQSLLMNQVKTLSNELNSSPYGLLDDYPGQCYPIDILPAIAAIQRASKMLGLDTSVFVKHSIRAFQDSRLDPATGLPAYIANAKTGEGYGPARGVGMSYMLIWAPELWPEIATNWYQKYQQQFWQEGFFLSGFREFSKNTVQYDFFFDVDAGPVVAGYGVAASAFGLGAAKVNNRIEHVYPLAAEALVASWPLFNGSLLVPKILSNLSDAPYLGESALLFIMTRESLKNVSEGDVIQDVKLPFIVYIVLFFYVFLGVSLLWYAFRLIFKTSNTD